MACLMFLTLVAVCTLFFCLPPTFQGFLRSEEMLVVDFAGAVALPTAILIDPADIAHSTLYSSRC